jgi:hypothetical protein
MHLKTMLQNPKNQVMTTYQSCDASTPIAKACKFNKLCEAHALVALE